jgi:hypothetical protein
VNIDAQAREAVRAAQGELAMVDVPEAGAVVSKRRGQHRGRVAAAGVLCALVVIGGAAAAIGLAGSSNKKTQPPVAVNPSQQRNVQFRKVLETVPKDKSKPCAHRALPDAHKQDCYILGPTLLEQRAVKAEASWDQSNSQWLVLVDFANDDFVRRVAAPNVGAQIAIVVNDEVLSAPTNNPGITGSRVQIASDFTKDEARGLVAALRGVDVNDVPVPAARSTVPQVVVPEQKGLNIVQLGSTPATTHQFSSKDAAAASVEQGANREWVIRIALTSAAKQRLVTSGQYFGDIGSTMAEVTKTDDGFMLRAGAGTPEWSKQLAASLVQQIEGSK